MQIRDRRRNNHMPIQRNFQPLRNRLSQNIRADSVLFRYLLDSRNVSRVAREHDAARIFAKQREFRRKSIQRKIHARTYALRECLLRQRDRQSAI